MNIGTPIKAVRKQLLITQTELANKCSLSQSALSGIENGDKTPTQCTINKICEVLNIPESIIYIMALEERDIPESKRATFRIIHPMIKVLVLQIARQVTVFKSDPETASAPVKPEPVCMT